MTDTRDRTISEKQHVNPARMNVRQGTAIYVGAILGAGILVLPSLAAQLAGPASLLAWGALLLFCIPVAGTFAALGARYPDGGGVATFVSRAFGRRASAVVGYWFYFALPLGAPATAFVGGQYVAQVLGGAQREALLFAALLVISAFVANALGIRGSSRIQIVLVGSLATLLVIACAVALPSARSGNLTPFAPHGYLPIGHAASLLFFSFAGWEAVTHLTGEFRHPERDLRRVALLTLVIITLLYFGVALTCVLVLGPRLPTTPVPISALLQQGIGSAAKPATAILAAMLTFGTMNAYLAGGSRLGAALARDGALPDWLAKGSGPGQIPRRSLGLLAVLCGVVSIVAVGAGVRLGTIMVAASACFLAVTVAGLIAGVKLLPVGRMVWFGAVIAAMVMGVVLLFSGISLLVPATLAAGALLYTGYHSGRHDHVRSKDAQLKAMSRIGSPR
jgi:amino acid efflux transporter